MHVHQQGISHFHTHTHPAHASARPWDSYDAGTRAAIAALLPARRSGLARWIEPAPGLMLRPHILPNGAKILFALNWSDRPQWLEVSRAAELHDVESSRFLSAETRWETPPLTGALLKAI